LEDDIPFRNNTYAVSFAIYSENIHSTNLLEDLRNSTYFAKGLGFILYFRICEVSILLLSEYVKFHPCIGEGAQKDRRKILLQHVGAVFHKKDASSKNEEKVNY
jgi:hypothetical protein